MGAMRNEFNTIPSISTFRVSPGLCACVYYGKAAKLHIRPQLFESACPTIDSLGICELTVAVTMVDVTVLGNDRC